MGDAFLITNNKLLVECGERLQETVTIDGKTIKRFLVSTDFTPKSSIKRRYTPKDLCDTDIKCSSNKIGEIINLAQMLNSVYWDKKHNGSSEKELLDLYKDISNLNILSCIEIDRAKKISPVDAKKELDKIRKKHSLGKGEISRNKEKITVGIRPKFFKYLDGGKDYKFKKFDTGMDYLNEIIDKKVKRVKVNTDTIPLKDILVKAKSTRTSARIIDIIKERIISTRKEINKLYLTNNPDRHILANELKEDLYNFVSNYTITQEMIYTVISRISKSYTNPRFEEYKRVGVLFLTILYSIDKKTFLSLIKVKDKENTYLIKEDADDYDVELYSLRYKKYKK